MPGCPCCIIIWRTRAVMYAKIHYYRVHLHELNFLKLYCWPGSCFTWISGNVATSPRISFSSVMVYIHKEFHTDNFPFPSQNFEAVTLNAFESTDSTIFNCMCLQLWWLFQKAWQQISHSPPSLPSEQWTSLCRMDYTTSEFTFPSRQARDLQYHGKQVII